MLGQSMKQWKIKTIVEVRKGIYELDENSLTVNKGEFSAIDTL